MNDDFPLQIEVEAGSPQGTDAVSVAFGLYPKLDEHKSASAGYEVYEEVEFVKIRVPGDQKMEYFQPASDRHKKRFPNAYQAFKNRTQGIAGRTGMPLEQWPAVSRSMAMTLKGAGIFTLEDLSVVGDQHIDRLGTNARELRDRARSYLQNAKDNAETLRIAKERDEFKAQLEAMQRQIDGMRQHGLAGNVPNTRQLQQEAAVGVDEDVAAAVRKPRAGSKAA